jgi:hypothetical protein
VRRSALLILSDCSSADTAAAHWIELAGKQTKCWISCM